MISIITTCFNSEEFILSCAESILGQTFKDFEWIVVDDGSSDHTLNEFRKISDPRVRLICLGHVGRGKALNTALHLSRGSLIAIQDVDDLSHPDRLLIQRKIMEQHPEIEVLGTEAMLIGEGQNDFSSGSVLPASEKDYKIIDVTQALAYYNPLPHSGLMIRRQTLLNVTGYNENRNNLYDLDLYVRLIERKIRLHRLAQPLIAKRIHPHQWFEKRNRLAYIWESLILEWRAIRTLHLNPLFYLALPALMTYRFFPQNFRIGMRKILASRAL